jgi:hypothetical protein
MTVLRSAGIVLLALLLLLIFLPVSMGMTPMEPCPSCPPGVISLGTGICLAILTYFLLAVAMLITKAHVVPLPIRTSLFSVRLERPPRLT